MNLQKAGSYTGYGQALSGFLTGVGTRWAGEKTYDSDQATADAQQLQSVSKRQSTASQMRSDEVAQLEAIRAKLIETYAQIFSSSSETNKAIIRA